MKVPRFDIFSDTDNDAQWIEVVEGLDTASRRMKFYAAKCPGKYFIFNLLGAHYRRHYRYVAARKRNNLERKTCVGNICCCILAEPR
jgi:hypothetical protein